MNIEDNKINCYIHYYEYDMSYEHPLLVIQGLHMPSGYEIDRDTGEITKQVCICHAYDPAECVCSYPWEES